MWSNIFNLKDALWSFLSEMQIIQTQKCLFDVHISIIKRNVGAPVHTHTHTVIHRNYVCRLIFVQRQLWKKKKSAGDTNLNQTCWISDALCSPRSPRRHVFLQLLNISQRRSRRPRPDSEVNYSCLLFFNHSWTSGPCASLYQELLRFLHITFFCIRFDLSFSLRVKRRNWTPDYADRM